MEQGDEAQANSMRELLERMERGQEEARREVGEARREMARALEHLAQLIVQEGERTRQAFATRT
jgi:hypothetical protein